MRFFGRSIIIGTVLIVGHIAAADASESSYGGYKSVIDNTYGSGGPVPVPAPVPIPEHGQLYIRGDLGLATHIEPDVLDANVDFALEDIDNSWSASAGVGYNFRESMRGDVTIEYRWDARIKATDTSVPAEHRTEIDSLVVLGSLYYDFGHRDRLTPYIGVGVGYVQHDTRDRTVTAGGVPLTTGNGKRSVDVAAAAMAGFSYALHEGFLLDAGYRFLHLGDAETNPTITGTWVEQQIEGIRAHEVRIGLRYEIY